MTDLNEFVKNAELVRQSYGIAMAQCTFGGPTGIWLECTECDESKKIKGSGDSYISRGLTDKQVSSIFRRHGWTGETDRMFKAKCPKCSNP